MMLLVALISALTALVNAENAYQELVNLPTWLRQPITAIYNDYLYVFGGHNFTHSNTRMWRISLANKFTLVGTTDVTHTLQTSQWELLNVTYPSYGVSQTGKFLCNGQCSATIGQYVYIVNPFNDSNTNYIPNVVYRLDLSADPPVFASQNDFDFAYGVRYPCVTAVADKLYITNGYVSPGVYSTDISVYDPATNTMTTLTANTNGVGLQNAGCVGNVRETNVYLLGGKSSSPYTYGYPFVDYYSIAGDSWTNPSTGNFDTANPGNTRSRFRCLTLPYRNQIECPGGSRIEPLANSVIFDIDANSNSYVDMVQAAQSYGLENYEFVNDGSNSASVMLIIGGWFDSSGHASDVIQYAVRYTTITASPTESPTQTPTAVTSAPTAESAAPTVTPTTMEPTAAPNDVSVSPTAAPTETQLDSPTTSPSVDGDDPGDGNSGIIVSWSLSFVLVFVSILCVIVV